MSSDSGSDSDLSKKFGNDSSEDEKEVKKDDKKDSKPQVQNSMLQQSTHIENQGNNIPQISMIETTESKVPEQSSQPSSLMKNDISNIKPKEEDDNGKKENQSDMSMQLDSLNFSHKSQRTSDVNSNPFFTKKEHIFPKGDHGLSLCTEELLRTKSVFSRPYNWIGLSIDWISELFTL